MYERRKRVFYMSEKRCYTVKEIQEILDASRPTVYAILKKKEFRWIQLDGGKYRISKKSFGDWLDKQPE
jgi:excisionase family DNA binding protein